MASYEEVLHLIRYRNWHTVSLFDRKFKLICSELNGRYVSNEFKVEVCELISSFQRLSGTCVFEICFKTVIGNCFCFCPVNN